MIGLAMFIWLIAGVAYAADEARCTELGANCICNTTLDATTITAVDSQHFRFNDGSTKLCERGDGVAAASINSGAGQVFSAVTSGEDITALPSGHTNTAVMRANTTNGIFVGHNAPNGTPTARRSIRFYKYYSSAYNSQSDTGSSCNANKIAQFGQEFIQGPMFTFEGGTWTVYDIGTSLGWNISADCCNGPGPGNAQNGPSLSGLKGKWWRFEIITHNAATTGAGTYWEMYVKNVTDNAAELKVLDTSQTMTGVGNEWTSSLATGLHPTGTLDTMLINCFRSTNGGTPCAGFASYSHYLYAAWDTDAGQRIGAASEIEGLSQWTPRFSPSLLRRVSQEVEP